MLFSNPQFYRADDARLCYYTFGAGEPLILLHGNGEDSSYFAPVIPLLARRWRVIAVDSRGHGRSQAGRGGLSFARMAGDLRCLFDHLNLSRAHILGFSDGGNLAIRFALDYPPYVNRLILNGANVLLRGVKPAIQLPVYPAYAALTLAAPFDREAARKREIVGLMARGYGVRMEDLRRIRARTLVIAGTRDMIFDRHTRAIAAALPDSRLCMLDGTHFIAAERPACFTREVARFLLAP